MKYWLNDNKCYRSMFLVLLILLTISSVSISIAVQDQQPMQQKPPWNIDVILWQSQLNPEPSWRKHDKLYGMFHKDYPDDLQVKFIDNAKKVYDLMWVRIIAYNKTTDQYLGICLNQPSYVGGIDKGDNVVFKVLDDVPHPIAIDTPYSYRYNGLPAMEPFQFWQAMATALNSYRQGNFGNNMEAIDDAIRSFSSALQLTTGITDKSSLFYLHFFLARCYSEKYETLKAIHHFKEAIKLHPNDEHAHMGLLAEYSLMVHTPTEQLSSHDANYWYKSFKQQVKIIQKKFPDSDAATFIWGLLNGKLVKEKESLTKEELARIQDIGSGPFRWKRK